MIDALVNGVLPPISILPAFTVVGAFADNIFLVWGAVILYYFISTRLLVGPCTILNAILWPIGFVVALLTHWGFAILYAAALLFFVWAQKRRKAEQG